MIFTCYVEVGCTLAHEIVVFHYNHASFQQWKMYTVNWHGVSVIPGVDQTLAHSVTATVIEPTLPKKVIPSKRSSSMTVAKN